MSILARLLGLILILTTFVQQKRQTRISLDREEDSCVQCINTYKGRSTNYSHIQYTNTIQVLVFFILNFYCSTYVLFSVIGAIQILDNDDDEFCSLSTDLHFFTVPKH